MNLAVLLYSHISDKPSYLLDIWPAEVRELGDSTELPSSDWQLMTIDEYNTYVATHKEAQYSETSLCMSRMNKSLELDKACNDALVTKTRVMTSLGFPVFMSKQDLSDFQNLYQVLSSGMVSSMPYVDADGNSLTYTTETVHTVCSEMLAQGMGFYGKKATLKAELASASTVEEINAITW